MKLLTVLKARNALPLDIRDADIQVKYKVAKFMRETAGDVEFYSSELAKIVDECAQRDQNGAIAIADSGDIIIADNMRDIFSQRSVALENTEVDCTCFSLSLDEAATLGLSIRNIIDLDSFIKTE